MQSGNVRLDPSIRGLLGKFVKKGITVTRVAELFARTWMAEGKTVGIQGVVQSLTLP